MRSPPSRRSALDACHGIGCCRLTRQGAAILHSAAIQLDRILFWRQCRRQLGDFKFVERRNGLGFDSHNRSAFIGGGQFGFNLQTSPYVVLGVEGLIDAIANKTDAINLVSPRFGPITTAANENWLSTATARVGITGPGFDHWLFYGKGGAGWIQTNTSIDAPAAAVTFTESKTMTGWLAGAGIEWAFAPNWTARIDYQYIGLENTTFRPRLPGDAFTLKDANIQTVTLGLNYLFNWATPPAPMAAENKALPPVPQPEFISSWLDMVSRSQAAQPRWITPIVTVTPRLEQEFRFDTFSTNQGSGAHLNNYGGGKGIEIIPTYDTELIFGVPPWDNLTAASGAPVTQGFGDWPAFLAKYRFASANEKEGNYIVTGFLQMSVPTGVNMISNNLYILQPTLAFGKGWGDFDFQATVSQQYPVASIGPSGTAQRFGDPVLANVALQYHIFEHFWPEFEVNYTYWPNGTREGLSQVLLTPGIVIGRIPIAGRNNLIIGVGYQIAVTANPQVNNNWIATARLTF